MLQLLIESGLVLTGKLLFKVEHVDPERFSVGVTECEKVARAVGFKVFLSLSLSLFFLLSPSLSLYSFLPSSFCVCAYLFLLKPPSPPSPSPLSNESDREERVAGELKRYDGCMSSAMQC